MSSDHCELCRSVAAARRGQNPFAIQEFESSLLVVGNHQRFEGYCVLVLKDHIREPFELSESAQARLFTELMRSARALQAAYSPWKINYGCYGNQVPHVHWHLFPRYENDPLRAQTPWAQAGEFDRHRTLPEQAREVAARIKKALQAGLNSG